MERLAGLENAGQVARVKVFRSELSTAESAVNLVKAFCSWAEGIDVLIQLTGGMKAPVSWEVITPEQWGYDISVNLTVPFFLAREAIAGMDEGSKVVLMSNASAQHAGGPTSMAYGVAKAGVDRVVKALAKFAAPKGVLVNAVSPGFIDTRFHSEQAGRDLESVEKRKQSITLPHVGDCDDVAEVIGFLISDGNRYMTGERLRLDGGDFL